MMSFVDRDGLQPADGAVRVGAELRAARERLGWALPDVAAGLRIRLPYLEAIEEGRLSALPAYAYAVGFVRTYATSLGLDPDEMARRFRAETEAHAARPPLDFPAPVPTRGVPAGAVVLLGLVIAAGAYVGWYRYTGSDTVRSTSTAAAPPEQLAAMVPAAPAPSPQVASMLPASPPPSTSAALPPAPLPAPVVPVPTPVPVTIAPPAPVPQPAPVQTRLVVRAKGNAWVQVRERGGKVLLNRVMHAGETWPVPMQPNLVLTTANAGAVDLMVDGVAAPTLGPQGTMKRDVPLDADALKAGKKTG